MPPELLIRPLHPGDGRAVQAFVQGLSPQARLERYFAPIRELTPRQLERITLPRDVRDLSVGVFDKERLIAMAQCACVDGTAEFGVVVADDCQGSGLGRELLERLLAHARRSGLSSMHGLVRGGNRAMLRLARSLGFRVAPDADPELLRVERPLAHA